MLNSVATVSESILDNWRHKQPPRKRYKDELEEFILSTTINVKNPVLWWVQHQQDYPQLSIIALDVLAIPAMSAEVERVFSSTGLLITARWNRLKDDIVEAVECMKSWASDGPASLLLFNDVEQVRTMLEELEDKGTNGQ